MRQSLVIVFSLLVASTATARELTHVLIVTPSSEAMNNRQSAIFYGSLADELRKIDGVEIRSAHRAAGSDAAACDENQTPCLTRLADSLGADEILVARVTELGETVVLSFKRIRIVDAEVIGATTRPLISAGGEEILLVLGDLVAELYPEQPLADRQVRGVSTNVVARWNPPPVPEAFFWTGAGLTVATGVTGLAFGLLTRNAQNEYDRLVDSINTGGFVDGRRVVAAGDRTKSRARIANSLFVATGALALTTGVLAVVTDFGIDDAVLSVSPSAGGAMAGASLAF